MKLVYYELDSRIPDALEPLVAAIGFFDGLHIGHQKLICETIEQAHKLGLTPALITFSPSPAAVLTGDVEQLLTTVSERAKKAKELGVEVMIVLRFSKELSQLDPSLFYKQVIEKLNIKYIVCGEDFRYGYRGSGNVETLKKIESLGLSVINDYNFDNERVSSSRIKSELSKGRVDKVKDLLGYTYELNGYVIHGRKKGRTIGFPTLNVSVEQTKILPIDGVYIGISVIKGRNYVCTINIGHNPTINTVKQKSIESFVHNYDQDTYGQNVTLKLLKRIRDEEKFSSVNELIAQMHDDIIETETYFDEKQRRLFNIETI